MERVNISATPNINAMRTLLKDTIPHCDCCTFSLYYTQYSLHAGLYMLCHTYTTIRTLCTVHTVLSYKCFTTPHMSHCAYCAYGAAHNCIYIFHFMHWTIHFILSPCIHICTLSFAHRAIQESLSVSLYIPLSL